MPDERPPNNPLQQTGRAFGDYKVHGSPEPAAERGPWALDLSESFIVVEGKRYEEDLFRHEPALLHSTDCG